MSGIMMQVLLIVALLGLTATAPTTTEQPQMTRTIAMEKVWQQTRGTLAPLPNGKKRTKCQELEGQGQLDSAMHIIGGYHPQCDKNGDYKAEQFHGGAGLSWCATPDGQEITPRARGANYNCEDERKKFAAKSTTNTAGKKSNVKV